MSITGERGFNQATKAVALLDAPVIGQADLTNSDHWINDKSISGKCQGATVYVSLTGGGVTTAVAQGAEPTDGWSFFNPASLPLAAVRKKMEVLFSGLNVVLDTSPTKLVGIVNGLTPTSGELNEFFNLSSNKLNVYNDDATLFFKLNITGTWNPESTIPNSIRLTFDGTNGNVINTSRTSGTDADVLQFASYISIDKDGFVATNGCDLLIHTLDSDFIITDIFITLEQTTAVAAIIPV